MTITLNHAVASTRRTSVLAACFAVSLLLSGCSQKNDGTAALTACPVCRNDMSKQAVACPHCGEPNRNRQQEPVESIQHTTIVNSIGMTLVHLPPGEFLMGASAKENTPAPEEQPQHRVRILNGFYLGCHEVTTADYRKIISTTSSPTLPAKELTSRSPACGISWVEANEFCKQLSLHPQEVAAHRRYRLPTEAEWEYACRAGTTTAFSTGDQLLPEHAKFLSENGAASNANGPAVTGSTPANAFGLHDMHGNVWEWCSDWFSAGYYSSSNVESPRGPDTGDLRSIRGGSWKTGQNLCRSAFRDGNDPNSHRDDYGFRVVCVIDDGLQQVATQPGASGYSATGGAASADLFSPPGELAFADLIEKIEPSVVRINTSGPRGGGCGSGFLVDDHGTILTNYHVVENATRARAVFSDGYELEVSGYLALLPERDLAVLRLVKIPTARQPLSISNEVPRKGERVIAFGAPIGLSFTASDGIVSAIRSSTEMAKQSSSLNLQVTWIQTTTPISPGNSGGPLVNASGKVIGINTITFRAGQNINFAVSGMDAIEVLKDSDGLSVRKFSPRSTSLSEIIRQLEEMQSP